MSILSVITYVEDVLGLSREKKPWSMQTSQRKIESVCAHADTVPKPVRRAVEGLLSTEVMFRHHLDVDIQPERSAIIIYGTWCATEFNTEKKMPQPNRSILGIREPVRVRSKLGDRLQVKG